MRFLRAAVLCAAVAAVGIVLVSGGSSGDPSTPAALPGLPPPFLGTAVSGDGGLTAAVDAYGDVVDMRAGPAGAALIDNPSARQAAGTVPAQTGIVPRMTVGGSGPLPAWRGESVTQRYLPGSNVVETVATIRGARLTSRAAAVGDSLALRIVADPGGDGRARPGVTVDVEDGVRCARAARDEVLELLCRTGGALPVGPGPIFRTGDRVERRALRDGRAWDRRATSIGTGAPAWARAMYRRSLLAIEALTSRSTGAVAAGARDGWAYVWPRDAATAALALAASGHRAEARRVAHFLTGLDLGAAARFTETGAPVPGRAAQGDAAGWVDVAARATGLEPPPSLPWRNRADYQESSPGTYLGNAIAAGAGGIAHQFGTARGLERTAGDLGSGLDSAAGWAVRPFRLRPLYPAAERTLLRLATHATRYGITPGEGWTGGEDPWSAPTAWSAWALAGLHTPRSRRAALGLLADLRRAATPAGDLPERVGAHTGIPTSTTPLLWSSSLAVLTIRELWPPRP